MAINSYEIAQKRWDAINGRIQALASVVVSIAIAVVVSAKALNLNEGSLCFTIATVVFFLMSVGFSLAACWHGVLVQISPSEIFEKHLSSSPWEFKKDAIYNAGLHLKKNVKVINRKWKLSLWAIILLGLAMVTLVLWAADF